MLDIKENTSETLIIEKSIPPLRRGQRTEPQSGESDLGEGQKIVYSKRAKDPKIQEFARELRNNATKEERKLWEILGKKPEGFVFRRQFNIDNKYIADFICLEKRLIIELDGSQHVDSKKDRKRTAYLNNQGFRVLRFWNGDIKKNLEGCYDSIISVLNKKSLPLSPIALSENGLALGPLREGGMEVVLNENSKLCLYVLKNKDPLDLEINMQKNSYVEIFFINSGQEIKSNINMQGENCYVNVAGVYNLKGEKTANIDLNINHNQAGCSSEINIRGIASDKSKANIKVKSFVAKGAIKTEASQLHKAIVLSDDAKIIAKPELEIYNDDVKCAHGNTIGQLDKQAIFYLQSRGIKESLAREMLIDGFLDEAVKSVSDNKVREKIFNIINGSEK